MLIRTQRPRMLRIMLTVSGALLASAWHCECADAATPAPRINCEAPDQRNLDLAPRGTGPLELTAIYCQIIRATPFLKSAPVVSPDGRSIAYYEHDTILRVAPLGGGATWIDYRAEIGAFARFGANSRSIPAFAWASNSTSLWTANLEPWRPSGFARTPLEPLITAEDGSLQSLPALRHDAGPLDALLWVDGDGLAIAQFGTRGGSYRPAHDDPMPSFAIVDAQRGLVLETLPFAAVETLRTRAQGAPPWALVRDAVATRRPDGRVRALLSVGQWIVWTQGEVPRAIADPYVAEVHNRMVISPDGSRILVGRLLRTAGGFCEYSNGCTSGTPVEGILAALHDLETGRLLWSIRATVTQDSEFPTPAISQDGRYALVGLVPANARPLIALVSMDDGEVVQTFPAPGANYAMGFVSNGLTVWTHAYGLTALYGVRARLP